MNTNRDWLKYPALGYSAARSLHYFLQFQVLSRATYALPFIRNSPPPLEKAALQLLTEEIRKINEADALNISQGYYPAAVLKPEPLFDHIKRLPILFWDGIRLNLRKKQKATKAFSEEAQKNSEGLPEYYVRNFHFQTDGYLSEYSAELYEHQVELLFSGTADAMRRLIIRPLKEALKKDLESRSSRLRFLELAGGTGRTTRFMSLAFDNSHFTVSDLSASYLKLAQKKLSDLQNIDFVRADATATDFKSESFDVVFTVFLFHELPLEEREKVIQEARRLLKPGGYFAAVDSLQLDDHPQLNQFLLDFPKQFHEPFYTNYIKNPVAPILEGGGFQMVETGTGFLSRYWLAQKK